MLVNSAPNVAGAMNLAGILVEVQAGRLLTPQNHDPGHPIGALDCDLVAALAATENDPLMGTPGVVVGRSDLVHFGAPWFAPGWGMTALSAAQGIKHQLNFNR